MLDGVRVLDFTRMLAGPWCTEVLADLGAEVIKVEEPKIGDPTRRHRPLVGAESSYYMAVNRGKQSIAVDLTTPEGKEVVRELIRTSDILVENFRPGVMGRLGLDFATVTSYKPDIVYCSLSGFGESGPLRDRTSFDIVNQALAGLLDVTGHPGKNPVRCGVPVGDIVGGLYMAVAVLAGLAHRRESGLGSHVDLSLHDAVLWLLSGVGQAYLSDPSRTPTRQGNLHYELAPYGAYRASDGWFVVGAFTEGDWHRLATALEAPELLTDERFRTVQDRWRHRSALDEIIQRRLGNETVADCIALLAGCNVPVAPVRTLMEALDSAASHNGQFVYLAHTSEGDKPMLASPIIVDGVRRGVGTRAPLLGADTRQVLSELGYDEQAISELIRTGAVVAR